MASLGLPALETIELGIGTVLRFMNIALGIVASGKEVQRKLTELNDQIETFKKEGRDPSEAEWAVLYDRSQAAHERIQNSDD